MSLTTATDGGTALDDCLHRWGYTLAKSEDAADMVATAVVAACTAPLARWNQQTLTSLAAAPGSGPTEAPSLLTGEPTTPIVEHNNFAQGRAMFYVVQARAGDCDPPVVETPRPAAAEPAASGPMTSPDR